MVGDSEMLDVLLNVSQSLYQHMDIENVIVHIVGLIKRLLNAEAVSVILHDDTEDEFIFRWLEDERLGGEPELKEIRFPTNQGIAGSVFSRGEPELILDIDKDFRSQVTKTRARLAPMKIGRHGQLQEWLVDWDNPEDQHSHVSHLYGLYPSSQINRRDTPKLFDAARTSLIHGECWRLAWRMENLLVGSCGRWRSCP